MNINGDMPPYRKPFGTSPVSDAYFKTVSREEEERLLRDLLLSSACEVKDDVPFEEFEGIGIDLSGPEPVFSKGWRKFFSRGLDD